MSILRQAEQHLNAGRLEQARLLLQRSLQKSPNDADLNSCMCYVLQRMGQNDQAVHFGKRAASARPADLRFIENIAHIFGMAGKHGEAAEILERIVAAEPGNAGAWTTLSAAYFLMGRLAESERAARRGLEASPLHPRLSEQLSAVTRKLGRAAEAYEAVRQSSLKHGDDPEVAHEAAFNSNYPSGLQAEEVFEAHTRYGDILCAATKRLSIARPTTADADRPLRIGFISPDFRQHSVSHYAEPLIERLDRSQFSVHLYFTHNRPDAVTERFRRLAQGWCDAGSMSDDVLAQRIAFDRIDILIDLAGLTGGSRPGVLARKPAPLQATYLGYPNTTGLRTVDYRLIDGITDPPGIADRLAVEKLVRLDPCFLCFRPPSESPEVGPLPSAAGNPFTFGSFNAGMKFSDQCVRMWAEVTKAVPDARLFLKNFDLAMPEVREHLYARFERAGVARERIEMSAFADSIFEHLRLYHRLDLALDTFPYHGTTTTCEAFHMGLPVVTLEGDVHAARVGCTLLRAVGLPELIARSEEEYIRIATDLAHNRERLAAMRASLRERQARSPLGDEEGFAARFGGALRAEWRAYCARSGS